MNKPHSPPQMQHIDCEVCNEMLQEHKARETGPKQGEPCPDCGHALWDNGDLVVTCGRCRYGIGR